MTSGFYWNSESVWGLCWKNTLALSSMLFFSTVHFLFYLLYNCSSVTPYPSPSITGKLEILTLVTSFPQAAPWSRSSHVVSALCHLMATFYTDPSQNITVPHLYSSFPFSPCFILPYQTLSIPLFFSLRHWSAAPSFPPRTAKVPPALASSSPWYLLSYTSKLKQCSLCSPFLIHCQRYFPSSVDGISVPSLPHLTFMSWFLCSYLGTSSIRYLLQFTTCNLFTPWT